MNWITHPDTQKLTHRWRAEESAILVGTHTVKIDNPSLTVRAVAGKNPLRIVIDNKLKLASTHKIFNTKAPTLVFNNIKTEQKENIELVQADLTDLTHDFCRILYERNIQSVIIEGGANTLQRFIDQNIWDEARVLTGNVYFGEGLPAPKLGIVPVSESQLGDDNITLYRNA